MITPTQRMLWTAIVLVLPVCAVAGFVPGLLLPCVAVLSGFLIAAALDARFGMRRVAAFTVTADAADLKWFKGRSTSVPLRLAGHDGLYDIALELPAGLRAEAPSCRVEVKDSARLSFACMPVERGRYQLTRGFVRTESPWRLWQVRGETLLSIAIRVFPDLEQESGAKLLLYRKRLGLQPQRPAGRGREFERLREYIHGDSYDELSWKATARRGKPVVKVFQVERTQDVYVILDASRRSAGQNKLERFVNAALMLALMTESEGDNFGLLTFHDRVSNFVPAARGLNHFGRCRDVIFDLQPSRVTPDFAELFTFLQLRIRRRSLLLFLTDLGDPMLGETFPRDARALARKHLVVVGQMRDDQLRPLFTGTEPNDISGIHDRLAGHLQWTRFEQLEKSLRKMAIGVCALRPEAAGRDLVNQYSDIKRRQLL